MCVQAAGLCLDTLCFIALFPSSHHHRASSGQSPISSFFLFRSPVRNLPLILLLLFLLVLVSRHTRSLSDTRPSPSFASLVSESSITSIFSKPIISPERLTSSDLDFSRIANTTDIQASLTPLSPATPAASCVVPYLAVSYLTSSCYFLRPRWFFRPFL